MGVDDVPAVSLCEDVCAAENGDWVLALDGQVNDIDVLWEKLLELTARCGERWSVPFAYLLMA